MDNEGRNVDRSERAAVHAVSEAGSGSPWAAENLEWLESRGILQPSSLAVVLDVLCLSRRSHKMF